MEAMRPSAIARSIVARAETPFASRAFRRIRSSATLSPWPESRFRLAAPAPIHHFTSTSPTPLIVLVGVTIAGAQAGIVGVFLATPMIASGGVVLQYILAKINEVPEIIQRPDESPSLGGQVSGFLRGLGRRLGRKPKGDGSSKHQTT